MPYLFTRTTRLASGGPASLDWALKVTEKVNMIGELKVSLWARMFSAELGSITWSTVVDDMAEIVTGDEKLDADSGFVELVSQGAQYSAGTGLDDGLIQLMNAATVTTEAKFAMVTAAVLAPGKAAEGIALGLELCELGKEVTGAETLFGTAVTGVFGRLVWISLHESLEQMQAGGEALAANPSWIEMIDKRTPAAYMPGSGQRWISRKVM